jgi:hypothetical protein
MKIVLNFIFLGFLLSVFAQNNYVIEHDKLTDKITYYQQNWVHGAPELVVVKNIRLEQNDIIKIRIVNFNPYIFESKFFRSETPKEEISSPFSTLLGPIVGSFGGPALRLLTQLVGNAPPSITRGESEKQRDLIIQYSLLIKEIYEALDSLLTAYNNYERSVAVIYDRSLTKNEILSKLKLAALDSEETDFSGLYEKVVNSMIELEELNEEEELDADHPLWLEIEKMVEQIHQFEMNYLDEEGEIKTVDIRKDIVQIERTEFEISHTFLAKVSEDGDYFSSNEFVLIFHEIKGEEQDKYPIDQVKVISLPIAQPNAPYWGVGIDAIVPIGGIPFYEVSEIQGDYFLETPDSLLISENVARVQLSIGTKLMYDIRTKGELVPSIHFGIGLSGLNRPQDEWRFNLLLGAGVSHRKFPWINLNAGLGFTQTKVLKEEYSLGRSFVKPTTADVFENYSSLFRKKLKPGLFIGLTLKL